MVRPFVNFVDKLNHKNSVLLRYPFLGVFILAFVGGVTPVFTKIALTGLSPMSLIAIRFGLGSLFLFPFLNRNERSLRVAISLRYISLSGFANPLFVTFALLSISASIVPPAYALVPFLIYLFSLFNGSEKVSLVKLVLLLSGFLGVCLVAFNDETIGLNLSPGLFFLALAVVCFAAFILISQESLVVKTVSPTTRIFHFSLFSGVVAGLFALYEVLTSGFKPHISIWALLSVFFVGLVGTGWQYTFMQSMIKYNSGVVTSTFTLIQPVMGILAALVILSEPLTFGLVAGSIILLVSVFLFTKYDQVSSSQS